MGMFGARLYLQAACLVLNCAAAHTGSSPDALLVIPALFWSRLLERRRDGNSTRVCLPLDKQVQETQRALLHPPAIPRQPNIHVSLTTFV